MDATFTTMGGQEPTDDLRASMLLLFLPSGLDLLEQGVSAVSQESGYTDASFLSGTRATPILFRKPVHQYSKHYFV